MAKFQYVAVSAGGQSIQGLANADNEQALDRDLEQRGLTLTKARKLKKGQVAAQRRLRSNELVFFTTQLATVLGAGVPVLNGLRGMQKRMRSESGRQTVADLISGLQSGMSLSEVMETNKKSFPHVYRACVQAGEVAGSLPEVLDHLARFLSWTRAMRTTTLQALLYPAILFFAIVVLITVMLTFLLPRIIGLFPGGADSLPRETKVVIAISDFLIHYGPLLALGGLVGGALFGMSMRNKGFRERVSRILLSIPRYGDVALMLATSRFASTAAILQGAGCEISTVLKTSGRTCGNAYLAKVFCGVADSVRAGQTITESLEAEPKMDPLLVQMAHVGETSGDLADAFDRLGKYYDEEVPRTVKWFLALLEPAMLFTAGIVVAFILVAALMPIFSLYENLS